MNRLYRPLSSFLRARGVGAVTNQQAVTIEKVKISRARRVRRVFTVVAAGYLAFSVYHTVVVAPLARTLNEAVEDLPPEDDDDDYEGLFIPLPFTSREEVQPPYASTDKEWRAFIDISRDREGLMKVRERLVAHVLAAWRVNAQRRPDVAKFGMDVKVRRFWLDIDFPYRPPPVIMRTGLLLGEEVEIVRLPVTSEIATMTQRILQPFPAFWSTVAYAEAMMKKHAADVKKMLGWDVAPDNVPAIQVGLVRFSEATAAEASAAQNMMRKSQETTRHPDQVANPGAMVARQTATGDNQAAASGSTPEKPRQTLHELHRAVNGPGPWEAFKRTWNKSVPQVRPHPPRGSFMVSGMVEIESGLAWIVTDVVAWYDPATKQYHEPSMIMRVRRMQRRHQAALR